MAISKIRAKIFEGVAKRTEAFNKATFPQASEEFTPEQMAVWQFLNGESGSFQRIHESDRPEIAKQLTKIAGIENLSRFDMGTRVTIPPYTVVTLRDGVEGYPAGFPLVSSRITGLWTENGQGSARDAQPQVKQMRPATVDDVNTIKSKFPEDKLVKLYGAIDFTNQADLRTALAEAIMKATHLLAGDMMGHYPEGITEKGKKILQVPALSAALRHAMSIVLDDPAILESFTPPPLEVIFRPYCAVVHFDSDNGQVYVDDKVHVQADVNPHDVFFVRDGDHEYDGTPLGNHAETRVNHFRIATDEEIKQYVEELKPDELHLYASALTKEQIQSLL